MESRLSEYLLDSDVLIQHLRGHGATTDLQWSSGYRCHLPYGGHRRDARQGARGNDAFS